MALLQPTKAIYHHPLDTETESLESDVWVGVQPVAETVVFGAAKLSNGLSSPSDVIYDASLGTVPDAQGWGLIENSGPAAASVASGVLTSTTTFNAQNQSWTRADFNMGDWTTDRFDVEFDLKIITSTIEDSGSIWRHGWTVFLSDANKRGFFWGVSDTGVRLSHDLGLPGSSGDIVNSTAFIATATTDDFHKYRLSVLSGIGRLYKDGSLLASIGIGVANALLENRFDFGAGSSLVFSDTRLRKITFPFAGLTGTGASYPSVIGSTKLAYAAWLKNPSA